MNSPQGVHALPAVTSAPLPTLLQVSLSLLLILCIIFGIAWLARRYLPIAARNGNLIKIISGVAVGHKEKVLLLEIGQQWVLIGVAPGQINLITTLTAQPDLVPTAAETSRFSDALNQQLQRWHKKT